MTVTLFDAEARALLARLGYDEETGRLDEKDKAILDKIESQLDHTDPREVGGQLIGGRHDLKGGAIVDTRNAVLMDHVDVSLVDPIEDRNPDRETIIALALAGRINKTQDRSKVLYLFDADGAAAIITELAGVAARAGGAFAKHFAERMEALP